jgi:CHASE2 domain-containing sensor protein
MKFPATLLNSLRRSIINLFSKIFAGFSVRTAVYVVIGAAGFLLVFFLIHLPEGPEHWSADLRTKYLSTRPEHQHDKIALIEITNETLNPYPYVSPINRDLLTRLIRTVDGTNPKAIGLDIIFDRRSEDRYDTELKRTIADAKARIVLAALDDALLADSERSYQSRFFQETNCGTGTKCTLGHIYLGEHETNPVIISEHVIRSIAEPSIILKNEPGLAAQSKEASKTQYDERPSFAEVLALTEQPHRVDGGRQISWLLPPSNGTETFLTLSAEKVLASDRSGLPIKDLLKDRFVLIGGNVPDRDQHLTPLSVWSETRFSGLFIHAQILAQLLADRHLYTLNQWYLYWPLLALAAVLGFLTGQRDRSGHHHLEIEFASVLVLILISYLSFYGNFIFPFVGVLVAWLAGVSGGYYGRLAHH